MIIGTAGHIDHGKTPQHMLPVVDWLSDVPKTGDENDLVEVQFKNTRKGYYHNNNNLPLEKGMVVIVEANPGCDMGEVTLMGSITTTPNRNITIINTIDYKFLTYI